MVKILGNNRREWGTNMQRDTLASHIGHSSRLLYFAAAENQSVARMRQNFLTVKFIKNIFLKVILLRKWSNLLALLLRRKKLSRCSHHNFSGLIEKLINNLIGFIFYKKLKFWKLIFKPIPSFCGCFLVPLLLRSAEWVDWKATCAIFFARFCD